VLYFIQSNNLRLGLIVLFAAFCSSVLVFLSNASNSEIIVATASCVIPLRCLVLYRSIDLRDSYAAVQVVFVSGVISSQHLEPR
jgi:hypothetical protein